MQTEWSDTFCSAQTRDVIALLLPLLESLLVSRLRKQKLEKQLHCGKRKTDNMTLDVHRQRVVQNLPGWKLVLISGFDYCLRG